MDIHLGLTGAVEDDLVLVDHIAGVGGGVLVMSVIVLDNLILSYTYVHSVAAGGLLASVTLSKSPVQAVGESVLAEVGEDSVVDLESREVGRAEDGFLGVGLDDLGLVGLSVDKLVVQDLDAGVFLGQQGNLVGDGLRIREGRNVLADTEEAEGDVLGVGTGELGLGLLTDNNDIAVGLFEEETASSLGERGVNTTAEALVGRGDDEQSLLVVQRLGLGVVEDGLGGLTVGAGLGHHALGTGELGRGDNLHRLGNLFDVADGLEALL